MSASLDSLHAPLHAPLIETRGLARVYAMGRAQVHALRGVDLAIASGEFAALMGASGCGKSTLLHLLGCLDRPTSGEYRLEGRQVSALSADERARLRNARIGFIFQNFYLLPRLTALENVALPLYYTHHPANARQKALAALERVGLNDRAAHIPGNLSGGERQRVAIARALINDPAVILADEPTGSLDSATGAEVMALLVELWREGRTILLVTHDANVAAHAKRTITMKDGAILNGATPDGGLPHT